jgi:hypothetical protein
MKRNLICVLALALFFSCDNNRTASVDTPFLDSLSRETFNFFWDQADSVTGNHPDRWPTQSFSSIASTGFGLTSYLIGVERNYITREQSAERVLKTLQFFHQTKKGSEAAGITGHKGFFYHFIAMRTSERFRDVELSTIDTGLLMMGILACQTYFDRDDVTEKNIRGYADSLYRAVEWDWAMNGQQVMSMGWKPESGFLNATWKGYNEAMLLYVLGLGSPTHPIASDSWNAWTETYQWGNYYQQEYINFGPLFGHQYSHAWIDFKGIQDKYMKQKGIDYFENSRRATYANRAYCISNPAGYVGYDENIWGLTACDGPGNENTININISFDGYSARGAAQWYVRDDGTISPTAAGGSIPFAPEICIPALRAMKQKFGSRLYGQYGFKDAFNLTIERRGGVKEWFDQDYLGIDQGPILIQLENYRSSFVWNLMKKNLYIITGLKKAGFEGGWLAAKK